MDSKLKALVNNRQHPVREDHVGRRGKSVGETQGYFQARDPFPVKTQEEGEKEKVMTSKAASFLIDKLLYDRDRGKEMLKMDRNEKDANFRKELDAKSSENTIQEHLSSQLHGITTDTTEREGNRESLYSREQIDSRGAKNQFVTKLDYQEKEGSHTFFLNNCKKKSKEGNEFQSHEFNHHDSISHLQRINSSPSLTSSSLLIPYSTSFPFFDSTQEVFTLHDFHSGPPSTSTDLLRAFPSPSSHFVTVPSIGSYSCHFLPDNSSPSSCSHID